MLFISVKVLSTELVKVKKDSAVCSCLRFHLSERKFGSLHFWSASNTDMIQTGFQQHMCRKTAGTFLELKLIRQISGFSTESFFFSFSLDRKAWATLQQIMINRSDSLARGNNRLLREILNTFHSSSLYKKRKCQHLAVIVSPDRTKSSFVRSEALNSRVARSSLCVNENVQGSHSVFSLCLASSFVACCVIDLWF